MVMEHESRVAGGQDPVEQLAAEYFTARETGSADPEAFARRLPSAAARADFRSLIATVELLDRQAAPPPAVTGLLARRYELQRRLGDGGFGDVWQCFDHSLHRTVAVKILRGGAEPNWRRDANREARLLAAADHPGIVRIHDVGEADGVAFLVMEQASGRTVGELIAAARALQRPPTGTDLPRLLGGVWAQPPATWHTGVAMIFARIARALDAVHRCGVVHRDLKPGNVMLAPDGSPKVLDFGLAGHRGTGPSSTGGLAGTPQYLAPEQLRSSDMGADARVDVYQLGALLYEAMTRRSAFAAADRERVFARILAADFSWPRRVDPAVPRALEDVVLRAMHPEPGRRYASMADFAADLEACATGQLPAAAGARIGPWSPLRVYLLGRRHARSIVLASVAAVALTAGLLLGGGGETVKVDQDGFLYAVLRKGDLVAPVRFGAAEAGGGFGQPVRQGEHAVADLRPSSAMSLADALLCYSIEPTRNLQAEMAFATLLAMAKEQGREGVPEAEFARVFESFGGRDGAPPRTFDSMFGGAQVRLAAVRSE